MVSQVRTYLVDDIDGSDEDVSTLRFSLDKQDFEIDLSASNEARLREKLAKFVDAATPVKAERGRKTGRSAPRTAPGREQTQAVRDWARNNGYEVSERGRISKAIQEAFEAAH